jgi:hypothetical protein
MRRNDILNGKMRGKINAKKNLFEKRDFLTKNLTLLITFQTVRPKYLL